MPDNNALHFQAGGMSRSEWILLLYFLFIGIMDLGISIVGWHMQLCLSFFFPLG